MTPDDPTTGRRLGRRAPSNKPALRLGNLIKAVPDHPLTVDHLAAVTKWRVLGNQTWGDCGPVSVANSRALVTKTLAGRESYPGLTSVIDLYRRSGNPGFDTATGADDNGVDMQTMLEAVHAGGIAKHKAVAFAKVDHRDLDQVKAAIAIFGFVLLGADMQQAQARGLVWDLVPGSPDWGGHAVLAGSYRTGNRVDVGVVSWGEVIGVTDAWWSRVEEAWAVVWPEHLGSRQFQQGISLTALADDYRALTGRALPIPAGGGQA